MKQFLRTVRCGRWYKHPEVTWLKEGELQGDALCDIRAQDGRLSVYIVTNKADRQRVAVALAATREEISSMDYIVFVDSSLESLGITIRLIEGDTPDSMVNELHYELGNLTVKRLAQLAEIVSAGEHKRIWQREIKTMLHDAASTGRLDRARVKHPKMHDRLPWSV